MKKLLIALVVVCQLAFAADSAMVAGPESKPAAGKKAWWASVALLGVASALDVHSSWGKPELNPMLRGADGRFGARGMGIKFSIVGATTVFQWLALRHHPRMEKDLALVNAGIAGWFTGAAIHNYGQ